MVVLVFSVLCMLMTFFVVSADISAVVGRVSTVEFPSEDCGGAGYLELLPNDAIRSSWGDRPAGYGKWGYAANLPPYSPPYQKTGHPADVFDGDMTTGYVWKTVSVAQEDCPQDSTNCQQLTASGIKLAAYNQGAGGRRCHECLGVSGCEDASQTVLPICSTAVCSYCDNLDAVMSFDTMEYLLVENVSIVIRGERRSPRSFKFYYSVESIEGPYMEFNSEVLRIEHMAEGRYNFTATDHKLVIGRYWRLEILSNFGDPEHVELLELQLYGRQLVNNKLDSYFKWIDPNTDCDGDAVTTTTFTFGFASEQSSVNNGQFILNVNSIPLGPFSLQDDSATIRDVLHAASFEATVSKIPMIVGNKHGQEYIIEFYSNVIPILETSEDMYPGITKFPSDVFKNSSYTNPNMLNAYCVGIGKAAIISTFNKVPANNQARLCQTGVSTNVLVPVYGINGITPTYGPKGGTVRMYINGNVEPEMNITMVSNDVSSSKDCLSAVSILEDDAYPLSSEVMMVLNSEQALNNARFCVRYSDEMYAIVPSAYFMIQEALVTEVITPNCNLVLLGETVITLKGSGLHKDDEILFATGNCEDQGTVLGRGYVISENVDAFEAQMNFVSVGDGSLIAYFSGMCKSFSGVTIHAYDVKTDMSHLISGHKMDLVVYGQGELRTDDQIIFMNGNDVLNITVEQPTEVVVDKMTFSVTVNSEADLREYTLYYRVSRDYDVCALPFKLNGVFTFHNVSSVTTKMSNSDVKFITTVLNKETMITLTGLAFNETDIAYYWNEEGKIRADIKFFSISATQMIGNITFVKEGYYFLVYGFENGGMMMEVPYTTFAMNVSSITAIAVGLESSTVQMTVKGLPTLVEYIGHGIHDINREESYYNLTPNPSITGGNDANGMKYASNRAVASHGPYVTVDSLENPMDAVFAFENGGRSTELNHWIIYDLKNLTTIHQFGMYMNSVFFQQLPRDFQLQRLLFCYDDSCLFDGDGALENAPWETVLSVTNLDKNNATALGQFQTFTLDRDVTARYYRLYITKNWGNTVYTSVIQVNFVGVNAVGSDMNLVQWVPESETRWNQDKVWIVSANGHSTLNTFTTSNRTVLWYDFSRTDSKVDPIRLDHLRINVAEVNMDRTWLENKQVASNVITNFKLDTVYGRTGDKIKFAMPGSLEDSACWTADSEAFGSVIDVHTITLKFSYRSYSGSFIVKTNNTYFKELNENAENGINVAIKKEKTVPIFIQDTNQVASIKMEQLTGVDKAQVVIQHTSSNTVTVTISVLEPSLTQPNFELIVPDDGPEKCRQCDYVDDCVNTEFTILQEFPPEEVYTLRITNTSRCSLSYLLLNREYNLTLSGATPGLRDITFTPVMFVDNKTMLITKPSFLPSATVVAGELKTCPTSNICTAFSTELQTHTIVHEVKGHAAVGVIRALGNDVVEANMTFVYNPAYSNLNAPLCYKFGDLPWKLYYLYQINLRSVIDIQPRDFIAGESREVLVTGTTDSIHEGDSLRVLWRGVDCTNRDNFVEFYDGYEKVTELRVGADNRVTMNFVSSSFNTSDAFTLCYKFYDDEMYVNYPLINFNVMSLVNITAFESSMANDLIVANQDKTFYINGNGLSDADSLFFVRRPETECNEANKVDATMSSIIQLSQNQVRFTVSFPDSYPDSLKLCYRFASYDVEQKYIMSENLLLYVATISSVTPNYGFVNEPATQVMYIGQYPSSYDVTDYAEWVLETDPSQKIAVSVKHGSGYHTSSVEFKVKGRYILNYRFGNEPIMTYNNIYLDGLELTNLQNQYGVVGCLYHPIMDIYYYRSLSNPNVQDSVSFRRVGGSCSNSNDLLPIVSASGAQSNRTNIFSNSTELASAEFLVSGISGGSYSVCYHWSNMYTVDYADIQATFFNFIGFSIAGGSTSDSLVERIDKTMTVMGSGVGEGDEIRLIIPQNSNDPMCTVEANKGDEECENPYEDKTFTVSTNKEVVMRVDSTPSGKLQVCYKFKNVDYFVKMPVYLTVAGLNSVIVDQGSSDVMVVGVEKTFTFNGLGISVGDHVFICDVPVHGCYHNGFDSLLQSRSGRVPELSQLPSDGEAAAECEQRGSERTG